MITDDGLGKDVIEGLAKVDVAKYGYRPVSPALPLIEGYSAAQIEAQDRIARIVFSSIMGALRNPQALRLGSVGFANAVAKTVGILLAETGWSDEGSERKIEVKRDAG